MGLEASEGFTGWLSKMLSLCMRRLAAGAVTPGPTQFLIM